MAATPLDHVNRAHVLCSLASKITLRSDQDLNKPLGLLCDAWKCTMSPPRIRICGAYTASLILASQLRWQESSYLLGEAVKTLLQLSPRFLGRDDQEYSLSNPSISKIAAEAAAIALQVGEKASHCLALLEHGRGIISGLVIDCRSDLTDLRAQHPRLFAKFNHLRNEIDTPLTEVRNGFEGSIRRQRRTRGQLVEDFEETLSSIRQLPNFKGFLLPPPPEGIMSMAEEGPIIVINSTRYRSDAIIITSSSIRAIALPELKFEDVNKYMDEIPQLAQGKRSTYPLRNKAMAETLLWLWNVAVGPVLRELQLNPVNSTNLTRIWWIGVGPLAMAPFHAAGDHSNSSTNNTISRAISSYIPNIKSLSYAREKNWRCSARPTPTSF